MKGIESLEVLKRKEANALFLMYAEAYYAPTP